MHLPHHILYTDRLPVDVGGRAYGPLVLIRPKYLHDTGMHEHELEHVRQWWTVTLVVGLPLLCVLVLLGQAPWLAGLAVLAHRLLRSAVRDYRIRCEARAYAMQTRFPDRDGRYLTLEQAADLMTAGDHYDLGITRADALAMLQLLEPDVDME